MVEKIISTIVELKIPSIVILVLFGLLTYFLLNDIPEFNSTKGIAGLMSLGVTVLGGIFLLLENIIKERYEAIIKVQQTALSSISKTHSKYENIQRGQMTTTGVRKEYQEIEPVSETKT